MVGRLKAAGSHTSIFLNPRNLQKLPILQVYFSVGAIHNCWLSRFVEAFASPSSWYCAIFLKGNALMYVDPN